MQLVGGAYSAELDAWIAAGRLIIQPPNFRPRTPGFEPLRPDPLMKFFSKYEPPHILSTIPALLLSRIGDRAIPLGHAGLTNRLCRLNQ